MLKDENKKNQFKIIIKKTIKKIRNKINIKN